MRRLLIVAAVVLALAGVTLGFSFHHPPMRLMPPPLLFQEGGDAVIELAPALVEDSRIDLFYATSRLPVGPRDNRVYTVAPDRRLHVGTATMRIGPEGSTLDQLKEWTTGTTLDDRPFIHLERLAEAATLEEGAAPDAAAAAWLGEIDAALAASRGRDLLVYVHGANSTVERAAGQAAQLHHFAGREAVVVLFAWPTAENFLRYPRDIETAFGAAPKLAAFLGLLAGHTSARSIEVFTYSAGATIGSDALALLAAEDPVAAARLGEVYHAAPDADFRAFVDDLAVYAGPAERVTAAVNLGDSALRLAAAVNRGSRAGRPDLAELDPEASGWLLDASASGALEILQVRPEAMQGLSATSHTFWYDDPWVSNDLLVALLFHMAPGERGLEAGAASGGQRYWTFTPDYPAEMPGLRERIRARFGPSAEAGDVGVSR
jgi:esterase/lipase superfamily enzyme